jgi:hypothetical protein
LPQAAVAALQKVIAALAKNGAQHSSSLKAVLSHYKTLLASLEDDDFDWQPEVVSDLFESANADIRELMVDSFINFLIQAGCVNQ